MALRQRRLALEDFTDTNLRWEDSVKILSIQSVRKSVYSIRRVVRPIRKRCSETVLIVLNDRPGLQKLLLLGEYQRPIEDRSRQVWAASPKLLKDKSIYVVADRLFARLCATIFHSPTATRVYRRASN
jgi:hypothetical protein